MYEFSVHFHYKRSLLYIRYILYVKTCLQIGSPTALADSTTWNSVKDACFKYGHSVYVPNGAFWGGEDIKKMADLGTLEVRTICANFVYWYGCTVL